MSLVDFVFVFVMVVAKTQLWTWNEEDCTEKKYKFKAIILALFEWFELFELFEWWFLWTRNLRLDPGIIVRLLLNSIFDDENVITAEQRCMNVVVKLNLWVGFAKVLQIFGLDRKHKLTQVFQMFNFDTNFHPNLPHSANVCIYSIIATIIAIGQLSIKLHQSWCS